MMVLRLALRRLAARPGFTLVAIGTLALGIGANAAIFSVVRAVLLRPLPYSAPDELIRVLGFDTDDNQVGNLSPGDFMDFARDSTRLVRMGAHGYVGSFTVAGGSGDAERVGGVNVTAGFFPTLGVEPALGRPIAAEDDAPGAATVVLLSDGFWRRRFAADPSVVGSRIQLNARPATIIGVLPASYRHVEENPDRSADVFVPYGFNTASPNRGAHFIRAVGRLGPGARLDAARLELETIAARLAAEYPISNHGQTVRMLPLHDGMVGDSRQSLLVLSVAVGLVLLIACANLANLLMAAGAARQREFAVRTALGASRGRLVSLLLGESLVLSGIGAIAGLGLAWWAVRGATVLAEASIPRSAEVGIDGAVLAFVTAIALVTAVLFGLVPALQLSTDTLPEVLKEGGRHAGGLIRHHARQSFIAVQVALAMVLLVGAGLFVRSFWQLQRVPTGFAQSQVTAMDVALPTATYPEGDQVPFYERLQERVAALPGVSAVGAINILPLSANYDSRGIQIEDHPKSDGQGEAPQARSVTPGYFRALGIPLVRGRLFDARDVEGAPRVVLVSEAMARRYWPGEDPIGRRMTFNSGIPTAEQRVVGGPGSREVVGIVGDVRHLGLDEGDVPMFYTPHGQQPSYHTMTLVVRTAGPIEGLAAAARAELRALDQSVPLYQVRSIDAVVARAVARPRIRALLVGLFAALACLLASLGVYGVVSYLVTERMHEIGIRMSLGATAGAVLGLVIGDGLRPVIAGVVVGLAGAFALGRAVEAMLFGISSRDPLTYAAAVVLLVGAALLAMVVPARRALRGGVDSMIRQM
jgi:putative ABC transport system permease protein